jgi:hypothetical protein
LIGLSLWSALGYGSWYKKSHKDDSSILWAFSLSTNHVLLRNLLTETRSKELSLYYFKHNLWKSLVQISSQEFNESVNKLIDSDNFFWNNFIRIRTSNNWSFRFLEYLFLFIGPGFYIYLFHLYRDWYLISKYAIPNEDYSLTDENLVDLSNKHLPITSNLLDWRSRKDVKDLVKSYRKLNDLFHQPNWALFSKHNSRAKNNFNNFVLPKGKVLNFRIRTILRIIL